MHICGSKNKLCIPQSRLGRKHLRCRWGITPCTWCIVGQLSSKERGQHWSDAASPVSLHSIVLITGERRGHPHLRGPERPPPSLPCCSSKRGKCRAIKMLTILLFFFFFLSDCFCRRKLNTKETSEDNLVRKLHLSRRFSFIYPLKKHKYC